MEREIDLVEEVTITSITKKMMKIKKYYWRNMG